MKIGVNAFIIARETEGEARAVLQEIIDKADPEAVKAFGHEVKNAGAASPEGEGNWAKSTFEDLVHRSRNAVRTRLASRARSTRMRCRITVWTPSRRTRNSACLSKATWEFG